MPLRWLRVLCMTQCNRGIWETMLLPSMLFFRCQCTHTHTPWKGETVFHRNKLKTMQTSQSHLFPWQSLEAEAACQFCSIAQCQHPSIIRPQPSKGDVDSREASLYFMDHAGHLFHWYEKPRLLYIRLYMQLQSILPQNFIVWVYLLKI